MKKHYLCILLPLMAISCSQIETEDVLNTNIDNLQTKNSEVAELKQRCNIHIEDIRSFEALTSDKENPKVISEIVPLICEKDTVVYVVNYADNRGWTLYPSDKRAPAILASAEEGKYFNRDNDPGMNWTGFTCENIHALKNSSQCDTLTADFELWNNIQKPIVKDLDTKAITQPTGEWHLISVDKNFYKSTDIGPLTKTEWHQQNPWNQCVPYRKNSDVFRCVAGCVAIAGAQCVYALHETLGIPQYFYSDGGCLGWSEGKSHDYNFVFANRVEDWSSKMATDIFNSNDACFHASILIGYVGREAGVKWGAERSGTKTKRLVDVFKGLGIDSEYGNYDVNKILTTLKKSCPVVIKGCTKRDVHHILGIPTDIDYGEGHAWLIDGYEMHVHRYTYHYEWIWDDDFEILPSIRTTRYTEGEPKPTPIPTSRYKTSTNASYSEYITMNWGRRDNNRPKFSFNNYNEHVQYEDFKHEIRIITGFKALVSN